MTTNHIFKAGELIRPISNADGWQVDVNGVDLEEVFLSFDAGTIGIYLRATNDSSLFVERHTILVGDKLVCVSIDFWEPAND